MKKTMRFMAIAAPAALMLAACTPPNSGNLVSANQAQQAQTVNFGTVVSVNPVNVQGGNTAASVTGTLIGGIAGAIPPLLGWTAVTNELHPYAWLLVLIIFVWTPPHFWALAIHRADEYAKADVPMLPVTHGIPFTRESVLYYTILLFICSLLPYLTGMSGLIYLVSAVILSGIFLVHAVRLRFSKDPKLPMKTFGYSIVYLFVLFTALLVDHYIPVHPGSF